MLYVEDNFDMVRRNKDKKHNQFGKSLIDLCCTFDIHVMNGRLFDDRDGNITCTSGNGSSVVDYNIASTDLFKYATYFCVLDRSESDHFPIQCSFSFPTAQIVSPRITRTIEYHNISSSYQTDNFKWDENKKQIFIANFSLKFTLSYDDIVKALPVDVNGAVTIINDLFKSSAIETGMRSKSAARFIKSQPPW